MTISKILQNIECMYKGLPFKDEDGRLIYVSDTFDCLLTACELFEKIVFKYTGSITVQDYDQFLLQTLDYIKSIDIQEFREKAKFLDRSTKEVLLRNFDKINRTYDSGADLTQYTLALL